MIKPASDDARILLLDLETAPNLGWVWGKWEQNVLENKSDWYILCFSYKWLEEGKVRSFSLPQFPNYKKDSEDDSALCAELWKLMNEADVIVAHNGDAFDIKKANARFLVHGMKPPKPRKTIDTKKVAKKYFKFDSNKLDEIGRYLKIGRKIPHTGFELWKGCIYKDEKSWNTMVKYCANDVVLLEKVFLKLRPWITNYPVYRNNGECDNCGSTHVTKRGFDRTRTYKTQKLQCQDCWAWGRGERTLANP